MPLTFLLSWWVPSSADHLIEDLSALGIEWDRSRYSELFFPPSVRYESQSCALSRVAPGIVHGSGDSGSRDRKTLDPFCAWLL